MAVVTQQLQQPAGDGLDGFEAMLAMWCGLDPPAGHRADLDLDTSQFPP